MSYFLFLTMEAIYPGRRTNREDVLITFEDGRMGIYSAELLHATLPQAEEVIDEYQEGERVIPFKLPRS